MSGKHYGKLGWCARRMVGGALADLYGDLAGQAAELARLREQVTELAEAGAALREAVAMQSGEIERLRIEALVLERRLDGESRERTTLGQALFERIAGAGR